MTPADKFGTNLAVVSAVPFVSTENGMFEESINVGDEIPPNSADPFSNPPELTQVVQGVKVLEEWYSSTFRRRITEITELLSTQISEELRVQFEQERRSLIVAVDGSSEKIIEALRNEISQLRSRSVSGATVSNVSLEEIARIEKQIRDIEAELEQSFTVDSVPLSRLLQLRTKQADLKSYLRGLKFCGTKSSCESNSTEPHSLRP